MMLAVTLAFVAALAAMSRVAGVAGLLLTLLAVRFLGFGSMQLVSNNVIAQWFVRRRGMVMGLASQSLAVSLFVFPALAEMLIRQFTWRGAWIGLSALIVLVIARSAGCSTATGPNCMGCSRTGTRESLCGRRGRRRLDFERGGAARRCFGSLRWLSW